MIAENKIYWRYAINTQLVIFDLDGTLCDTFDDIYLSLKYSLDLYNIFTPSLDEVKSFVGDGLAKLVERTLNVTNKIHLKDDIMNTFLKYYEKHCTDSSLLFPGMDNILCTLYNDNISMAVVSNKAEHLVKIIIDKLNISKYFKFMFGGDSFSDKKPNPVALNYVLDKLNIKPENAIMVGDSDNDVIAGKAANMKTCFCTFGYSNLVKSSSDYTIDAPLELIDIIKGI